MAGLKETSCRLCLKNITEKGFQVIDCVIRDIVDILLLKLKFHSGSKEVVCNACKGKLNAALDFKATCLNTDNTIIPYVDFEKMLQLDLGEIYMKENGSGHLTGISHDRKICRLCMQLIKRDSRCIGEEELEAIHKFVPEMNITIIKDPVVCKPCFDALCIHNTFLKQCLDVDQSVRDIFECSAAENQMDTFSPDSFIKNEGVKIESEIKEEEMLIKTECVDIKSEDDGEGSDTELQNSNSEKYENSNCKDEEEEGHEHIRKHKNRLVNKHGLETRENSFTFHQHKSDKSLYKCDKCVYETGSKSRFMSHYTQHKKTLLKKCILGHKDPLKVKNKHKKDLANHVHEDPSKMRMYKCDACDFGTRYQSNLNKHRLIHKDSSEVKMYQCNDCNYKTKFKHTLARHVLRHKNPSQLQLYKCDACDFESKYKVCVNRHQLSHKDRLNVQMYKCDACDFQTRHKNSLAIHQLIHKDSCEVKMYECNDCDYKTKFKGTLARHVLRHKDISQMLLYRCDGCSFVSRLRSSFVRHRLTHKNPSETQMYRCNDCNYITIYKKSLETHVLIHKDPLQVKMYKCDACDYKSKGKSNFTRHQLIHKDPLEVQMYRCEICEHITKWKALLKRHMLTHKDPSEVQRYSCNDCGYKTRYKNSLASHVLVHKDPSQVQTYVQM